MMDDQLYRELILDVYRNPKNQGEIADPDIQARLVNPLCGDEVRLQIKLTNNRVGEALFSGNGCAIFQVSASLLANYIEGKLLEEVKKVSSDDIIRLLGVNPALARQSCALLSLNVLKEALIHGS